MISLVAFSATSTTETVGEGYQVTTPSINDYANSADASQLSYTVVSFCTLANLPGFRLDPPRGKARRYAVCLITKRDEEAFFVHKLDYIEPDQIDNAVRCFQKLRQLCKSIMPTTSEKWSHSVRMNAESVTGLAKKSRTLHAVPTDVSLERRGFLACLHFKPGLAPPDAMSFRYSVGRCL